MRLRQREREREGKIHRVGEGSTEQNLLLGYVSGLIKWRFSLLAKLALTELGQNRKGVTSAAFNGAVILLSLCLENKTPTSH